MPSSSIRNYVVFPIICKLGSKLGHRIEMSDCQIQKYVRIWKAWYLFWTVAHYTIGCVAIAAPIIASTSLATKSENLRITLTVVAALSAAFLTFLRSSEKAAAFLAAYDELERAIIFANLANGGLQEHSAVRTAFESGRRHILEAQATGQIPQP